jgi:hypothetical protein
MRIPTALRTQASRRAPLVILVLTLAAVTTPVPPAEAAGSSHPLYSDGGALRWYTDLAEAQSVATREGKLILVDVSVTNCRACELTIGRLGDASIRDRVARVAIGYHVDARQATRWVRSFRANLTSASYLPLIGFFTPGSNWVAGFAPSRRTSTSELHRQFLVALDRASSHHSRMQRGGASPPTSRPIAKAPAGARPAMRPATRLVWYESVSEAAAAARAEGKIILVASTKPGCTLCKLLKNQVVPQVWRELSQGCVFYVYDITRPESRSLDRLVRGNLPRARIMPLAGFMTADSRWLHGFSGNTSARKLLADYRTALRNR